MSALGAVPRPQETVKPRDLDALRRLAVSRYVERTPGSKALASSARTQHADKSAIGAGFDRQLKEACYPIVAAGAGGSRITDVDGNEYVDILQGLGTNLFGHNPEFVRDALEARLRQGFPIGVQDSLVGDLAALVCRLTGLERACFSNTGTEAVMTALRLARAVSGRDKVVVFTNSYHGHADPFLLRAPISEYARRKIARVLQARAWLRPLAAAFSRPRAVRGVPAVPGVPASIGRDVLVLEYGSDAALEVIRQQRKRLAAVIVEPVQSRCPELQPAEFLRTLRAITAEAEVALIFDEMVTGFRLHAAGAQGFFGVKADIATYSKVAGGGMPLSVVAGSARYLDAIDGGAWQFGDDSAPGVETTFFAGTFCKHPLALTAAHAMLARIDAESPGLHEALAERTEGLIRRLDAFTRSHEMPVRFTRSGSFFAIAMTQSRIDQAAVTLLSYLLLGNGIHLRPGDRGGFLTAAHSDDDIETIAGAFETALLALRDAQLWRRSASPDTT
ncbi:MAG: aminotransferase class III-fold pyridoxal phosphate-dependent enzyme [Pseudomonadota bacterium]